MFKKELDQIIRERDELAAPILENRTNAENAFGLVLNTLINIESNLQTKGRNVLLEQNNLESKMSISYSGILEIIFGTIIDYSGEDIRIKFILLREDNEIAYENNLTYTSGNINEFEAKTIYVNFLDFYKNAEEYYSSGTTVALNIGIPIDEV